MAKILIVGLLLLGCSSQTEGLFTEFDTRPQDLPDSSPPDSLGSGGFEGLPKNEQDAVAEPSRDAGGSESSGGRQEQGSGGAPNLAGGTAGASGALMASGGASGYSAGGAAGSPPASDAGNCVVPAFCDCAAEVLFLVDRTQAMYSNSGVDYWTPVGEALEDLASAERRLGDDSRFFGTATFYPLPLNVVSQTQDPSEQRHCEVSRYEEPIAPFANNPTRWYMALGNRDFAFYHPLQVTPEGQYAWGGSSLRPALEGLSSYARSIQEQQPKHRVAIAVITASVPDDCRSDLESLESLTWENYNAGIDTFVVELGVDALGLDSIAEAGGTDASLRVPVAGSDFSAVKVQMGLALGSIYDHMTAACQ